MNEICREALELIAVNGCENHTSGSCLTNPYRRRGARYTAHAWCSACVARDALNRVDAEPRAYTMEEVRDLFLDQVRSNARYWAGLDGSNVPAERTTLERIQGALFSTLVILDGESHLPGFRVIPNPHPDDQRYHVARGERYFPNDVDIAGSLHDLLHRPSIKERGGSCD